jgi:hypothetical protein
MKKREEYQSKVSDDTGITRGRVPAPLLKVMGARAGDYLVFRLASTGEAIMRLSRSTKKVGKGRSKSR